MSPDSEDTLFELLVDSEDIDDTDATDLDEDLDEDTEDTTDAPSQYANLGDISSSRPEEEALASILSPGSPLVLLQRSHQHSTFLPYVIADAIRRHRGNVNLGVVAPLPRMSPEGVERFFDGANGAEIRIADPEAFARADSFGNTLAAQRDGKPYVGPSTSRYWRYLSEPVPPGGTAAWVEQVVGEQRRVGANVLLTPGVWADPADADKALDTLRQHTAWAHATCNTTENLVVNITAPAAWLINERLRDKLLNELVDMDDDAFYLRFRWPLLVQPYGQLLDVEILDGYAEVCNVLDENDKALILPNTGLTGWMGLAWGGHGFSTGIGSGERAFADTRVIKIGRRPRPEPTRRTLATPILHVTDVLTAERIERLPNVQACNCPFCKAQRQLPSGQFDKGLAGAHYLRSVIDLVADISRHPRGRRVAARRIVRDARAVVANSSSAVPLTDNNDPRHLPLWGDRLH
jgi:hypothetical protein